MAVAVATSTKIQVATAWTGTAPGAPGTQTVSGTLTSGVDVSGLFTAITVNLAGEQIEWTNFTSGGWKAMLVGLKEATLDLSLNAGFAAASDTDVYFGLGGTYGFGTTFYIDIMPTNAARGTGNPSTVLQVLNLGYGAAFTVGQLATAPLTLKPTGLPGRLTA